MALLQIAEPGLSAAPHQHRLAVGIDLGTTNSLVASVLSGDAKVLRDEAERALLPSVVRYLPSSTDDAPIVGHDAKAAQSEDPHNTLSSIKRLMGRTRKDVAAGEMPYAFVDSPGIVQIDTVAGVKTPIDVSADILRALALGAHACLIGRAFVYGLGAAGEAGVAKAISIIASELDVAMALTGSTAVKRVGREIISKG